MAGHERINEEANARKRDAGSSHPTLKAVAALVGLDEGEAEDAGRLVAGVVFEAVGEVDVGAGALDEAIEAVEEPVEDELPEELPKLGLEPARTFDAETSLDNEPTAFRYVRPSLIALARDTNFQPFAAIIGCELRKPETVFCLISCSRTTRPGFLGPVKNFCMLA